MIGVTWLTKTNPGGGGGGGGGGVSSPPACVWPACDCGPGLSELARPDWSGLEWSGVLPPVCVERGEGRGDLSSVSHSVRDTLGVQVREVREVRELREVMEVAESV